MSSELRLKKLRGSGGYIMATVTDEQQMKGNLGGPDLFLAPIGRLNDDKMVVTNCKVCNCEMDISTHYSGEFPLCQRHRNPNDRPFTQNKGYKKRTNNGKK